MNTPEELAREILDKLALEHGQETFVSDGYGYYYEAVEAFSKALAAQRAEGRREGLEEAAKLCDDYDTSGWVWNFQDVYTDMARDIRALKSASVASEASPPAAPKDLVATPIKNHSSEAPGFSAPSEPAAPKEGPSK